MPGRRIDSRVSGCGLSALASILFCFAVAAASADDPDAAVSPDATVDPDAAANPDAAVNPDATVDPMLAAVDAFIAELNLDKSDEDWKSKVPAPGSTVGFDPEKTYYWNLETNRGDLKIELFPKSAPLHVLSTIYLTRAGFYDDLKFHRIVTDFVVQGGDPTGTGNGGPGYRYGGEFDPELSHSKKGIVSMANAGPGTDGSQFFITCGRAMRLNGKHTIFGELAEGKPTLSKLERAGTQHGKPKRKAFIRKATISVE